MIKFKEFISEKNAQGNTDIKTLIAMSAIPLSTPMMDRLGYSYEDEAYHVTSGQYLDSLVKMQNKKKQISAFTKGGFQLMKLPSNPTILVKLEGNIVIDAASDMWTSIDSNGRRWINVVSSENSNGTEYSEKLSFFIRGIANKIRKDLGYGEMSKGYEGLKDINLMTKEDRNKMYKLYIDSVEKYLQKDGYKLLNKHLKTNITYDYNEVILNKFKIIGAYSLDNDDKKDEIEKAKIKYLGIMPMKDIPNIGK
jgi:hypothetical protein